MCGRYYVDTGADDPEIRRIIDEVNEKYQNTPQLAEMKTGEIFPADTAAVLTGVQPVLMKWGFSRFDLKGRIINARAETLREKPMFQKLFERNRCLVPASWYFEWEKAGGVKRKYAIGAGKTIYLAGLYRIEQTQGVPVYVIITKPAAENIAFIHDRMPAVIGEDLRERWLGGGRIDPAELFENAVEMRFRLADPVA